MGDIDFVVPYVTQDDPEWLKVHERECKKAGRRVVKSNGRFRDYGTLWFVLKGVRKYMPWVRNVFLLVERPSQVPGYVDEDVKVVYHKDIMPERLLPTYNSCAFEMYLWKIPGLSERFIYANDDMVPVGDMRPEDFFAGDVPKIKVTLAPLNRDNVYQCMLKNNEEFIRRMLGMDEGDWRTIVRMGHTISPMLRSTWAMLWEQAGGEIESRVSQFREKWNMNQDVAAMWHVLTGRYAESERRTCYYDMRGIQKMRWALIRKELQVVCMNDAGCRDYERAKQGIRSALLHAFD